MIRPFGEHRVAVVVLSTGHPERVTPLTSRIGKATWLCPRDERDAYQQYTDRTIHDRGGNVARARNRAVAYAKRISLPVLMVDDDFSGLRLRGRTPLSFDSGVRIMLDALTGTDFKLAACARSVDTQLPVTINRPIAGGMLLLLTGAAIPFYEDDPSGHLAAYADDHIRQFGGYLRIDALVARYDMAPTSVSILGD